MKQIFFFVFFLLMSSCNAGVGSSMIASDNSAVDTAQIGQPTLENYQQQNLLAGTIVSQNPSLPCFIGKSPDYEVPPLTKVKIPRIKEGEESYLFVEYAPRKERIIPRHKKRPLGKRKQKGQPQKDRFHFQRQPVKGKRR